MERVGALLAIPLALFATGFFGPGERRRMRELLSRRDLRSAPTG